MQLPSNFSGGLAFGNTEIQIHDTNNFSMAGTGNFVVWGWGGCGVFVAQPSHSMTVPQQVQGMTRNDLRTNRYLDAMSFPNMNGCI